MEYEKHFNISSRKKWAIGLDMAKMEMLGSAAGLEDASRVPYRPASLGKDGMTRRGYGVNTDLIYMYSQALSAFYLLRGAGRYDSGRRSTTPLCAFWS